MLTLRDKNVSKDIKVRYARVVKLSPFFPRCLKKYTNIINITTERNCFTSIEFNLIVSLFCKNILTNIEKVNNILAINTGCLK